MDKILEVRKLKISFRTPDGKLQAVRDISFDLERGKTLAIVGESGSGKSVTSKAILGILAGNSIIEGGEILYDGKDLLRLTEDEMYKIRGDKISMIFQDPLSSLNPIVKIGKQITEAMLLKNKVNRRGARKDFNSLLAKLQTCMIEAGSPADRVKQLISTFDHFNIEAIRLENSYNVSDTAAVELEEDIADLLFLAERKQKVDPKARLKEFSAELKQITDPYFISGNEKALADASAALASALSSQKAQPKAEAHTLTGETETTLKSLRELLNAMLSRTKPNFFRIGYYTMKNPGSDLSKLPVEEANEKALHYLEENFMVEFLRLKANALKFSYDRALTRKKEVLPLLAEARAFYAKDFTKGEAMSRCRALCDKVEASIDELEINKDNIAYTFRSSLSNAIERYFYYQKKNPKEEKRYAKDTKKRDALIARGKQVDWKVIPKAVQEPEVLREHILTVIGRLEAHYQEYIAQSSSVDFDARANDMVDYFKDKASSVVYKVTKSLAKERALKLMEEVGIPEPRIRYYQYPFEFSGGMRQRIVIAIALAANPDILICDEPTTALDVTIQAQILELINDLKRERNLSVIFITHDLGVVANMADQIAVMYAGKIVEYGTAEDVFYDPRHPYTWALLSSMPDLETSEKLDAIPGTPPNLIYPPEGDAFADRNKYAMQIDFEQQPPMFEVSPTHWAATWLLHPDAPKAEMPKIISERIARMTKTEGE